MLISTFPKNLTIENIRNVLDDFRIRNWHHESGRDLYIASDIRGVKKREVPLFSVVILRSLSLLHCVLFFVFADWKYFWQHRVFVRIVRVGVTGEVVKWGMVKVIRRHG